MNPDVRRLFAFEAGAVPLSQHSRAYLAGIGPAPKVLETSVLPLHQRHIRPRGDLNPNVRRPTVFQTVRFTVSVHGLVSNPGGTRTHTTRNQNPMRYLYATGQQNREPSRYLSIEKVP